MLVILSGVSGAGKDTIKKELIKRMENVVTLPSFTSRSPRQGEEEGVQYHFITKEEFEEKIKNEEFYEYDLHHENYYGTSKKLLNDKIASGKIIVKDIEVNGTENLVKLLKNDTRIVTIFLKVEKEELRRRLIERGENTEVEIDLRLGRLKYEESKIKDYDYVIKNDDFEKTVQIIMTIIKNEKELEEKKEII
jgi:guanylate kinase